ncbi:MAG: histidine kinase dimerization/phospho-acceptor domain-containing protein, partial [Nodosilinea sp.]
MALPPLDHFLLPVPAYGLSTPLGELAQALGRLEEVERDAGAGVCLSHVVVVDSEYRPIGALALSHLWTRQQVLLSEGHAEPRLLEYQPWLEAVVSVAASAVDIPTLTHLGWLAQKSPPPVLVSTTGDGQYLGVLSPIRILSWLAFSAELVKPSLASAEPTLTKQGDAMPATVLRTNRSQDWVLELGHALKTPMTTLLGLSTLLLDSRLGTLTERQFRYVSLMQRATRKLTDLVNLLIDWMGLESGQINLTLERVNLKTLIDELVPDFLLAQPT